MEIMKNLNDSEETIFLQAIDQNYIQTKENINQGISNNSENEDSSYSDFEEYNKNLNLNFIELNDDSVENSPNSKTCSNNENYSNSVFSNDSTEAETNNISPNLNTIDVNSSNSSPENLRKYSLGVDDNKNHFNLIYEKNLKPSWYLLNEKKNEEKNFSVNFLKNKSKALGYNEKYSLEEKNNFDKKKIFNPVKSFLKEDFLESTNIKQQILNMKEKLKKEFNDKIISHRKYLHYLNFYNRNIACGNFLPSDPHKNLNTLDNNKQTNLTDIDKLNNKASSCVNANKSNYNFVSYISNKPILSLNSGNFISSSINNNNKETINKQLQANESILKCYNNHDVYNDTKKSSTINNTKNTIDCNYDINEDDEPNIKLSDFIIVSKKPKQKKK